MIRYEVPRSDGPSASDPEPNVPSGFWPSLTWAIQRGKSGEVALIASSPATAIRTSSKVLASFEKKGMAPSAKGAESILSAPTAIRPLAVVPTSTLPPGEGAKPPVVGS